MTCPNSSNQFNGLVNTMIHDSINTYKSIPAQNYVAYEDNVWHFCKALMQSKAWIDIRKQMDMRNKPLFYSQIMYNWKSDGIQVIKQHKDKQM